MEGAQAAVTEKVPRHVAVAFVHGIFTNDPKFADDMKKGLRARLGELKTFVDFESVYWANHVRGQQDNFMSRVQAKSGIVDNRLRRAVIQGLGDAAAYQKTKKRKNSIYYDVHGEISKTLARFNELPKGSPLILIGHSLGCHIISTYAWDMNKLKQSDSNGAKREAADQAKSQKEQDEDEEDAKLRVELHGASPLCRLDTLAGLVTFGCNIPLFTFTFGPHGIFPITRSPQDNAGNALGAPAFPGSALPSALRDKAKWLNFYNERDVLGFPLKPLNDFFDGEPRLEDICVQKETPLSRLLPYFFCYSAHVGYWNNPMVLDRTAELIRDMVETPT